MRISGLFAFGGWGWSTLQRRWGTNCVLETMSRPSRYSISTNPLEYAAEVAYIVATSSPSDAVDASGGKSSDDEFEFSLSETPLRRDLQTLKEGLERSEEDGPIAEAEQSESESSGESEGERVKPKPILSEREDDSLTTTPALENAIEAISQGEQQKTIVIYGPTNYPNRQLVSKLVQSNPSIFTLVIPHTSRKKKKNEISGLDFHFISRKEMSNQIKKGNFLECVKISSPRPPKRKSLTMAPSQGSEHSTPTSPSMTSEDCSFPVNPWRHVVQVPSPLLTPKSRQRDRANTRSFDLYGTSKEALHKARLQGKPCVVLTVTYKGAEQLKKAGYEGLYVLLAAGEETEQCDAAERSEEDGVQPDHHIAAREMEQAFSELQHHTFQTVSSLPLSPRTKFDITRDEWENLPTVEMDRQSSTASSPISTVRMLTFNELLVHYQRERIGTKPTKTKKVSMLAKSLHTECDLALSLSDVPLSDIDTLHIQALQTIYQKLMGSALNCRRYGPHWQDIGFLGVDPGENLKEVGFFGIMQLVSFLDQNLSLAMEIFNYSREGSHQFPFAEVSMNLTEVALKSLHGGFLTKLCNKQDQVFVTLNNYHMAMFHRFFRLWKQSSSQLGPVIRDVENYAKKHPKVVIDDLLAYLHSGDYGKMAIRKISQSLSNPFTPFYTLAQEQEKLTTTTPSS